MKRKQIMATVILMLMTVAGCNNASETTDNAAAEILQLPYNTPETRSSDHAAESEMNLSSSPVSPESENPTTNTPVTDAFQENDSNQAADTSQKLDLGDPDAILIGGKVRSVSEGQIVISRTLMEDSFVTMPEPGSPDEVLVTIRCSDTTAYEHWTIQGGGAGITRKEAAFSDIKAGGGLEAAGVFDGEEFIASKIIIEVYE